VLGDHLESVTGASSAKLNSHKERRVASDNIRFGFHPPVGDSLLMLFPLLRQQSSRDVGLSKRTSGWDFAP
jgi:hypothetical protein